MCSILNFIDYPSNIIDVPKREHCVLQHNFYMLAGFFFCFSLTLIITMEKFSLLAEMIKLRTIF